mmetsp:Transcript_5357/g.12169  ORF Transcript_5357/g.12169 Transcript_5357/m.12169 type:complete len:186 (+) Transcript_5357:179-736(+)
MKLSLLALTTLLSTTAAFAPVKLTSTSSSSALHGLAGDEIREARTTFAPGHFTTIGSRGDGGRAQCSGEDVRDARTTFAPGHFDTLGSRGDGGRSYCVGDDVREERATYAPFDIEDGRVGSLGEIGFDSGASRREYIPASTYSMPRVSAEFVPHSSTGAGGHSPAAPAVAALPSGKSYGIGSWKK